MFFNCLEPMAKDLNSFDILPGLSTIFSGPVRILIAAVQIVSGTFFGCLSVAFGWIGGLSSWSFNVIQNIKEIFHGIGNLIRGVIATCPGLGNLIIYLYDKVFSGGTVLRRDAEGFYTLPHVNVPGFINQEIIRGRELNLHFGDFRIDTAKGILPEGWVLEE